MMAPWAAADGFVHDGALIDRWYAECY